MEINVEKDKQTGETKILSASAIGPEGVHQRGVKVYDDGTKVVYEVHSGGTIVENGVHKLSAKDVEELIQKAGQSSLRGGYMSERTVIADGNLGHPKEHMLCKEAKLEMVHKSRKDHASANPGQQAQAPSTEGPEAILDQPVTMIFMGYQNIEDEEETKKVLGYDETIKAELVLIDEDDEKSLREKTVTDVSTIDGNAAELVSGRPVSDTTEPSSPEGKEESLATEPAPAVYAMEINVEKDKQTGETKILSASAIGPEGVHQRGVKVYDDGTKVVYEVHSGGTIVENGVHKLSAKDVEELIQKAGQSSLRGGYMSERTVIADGNLGHPKEHMLCKEAKLEMVHKSRKDHASANPGQQAQAPSTEGPEAILDQPVTMIFMGYQNIEDEEETKKVLGYDETIKAELVLIDEDDEKSLREKTVTDVSTIDGNAAELVSGRPVSDTTEPSSPEGKEESLATEPAPGTQKKKRCQCCVVM
ncbi:PREDICTED: paralemmin-2 [Dipodomys ordii]|uniref:Paralemmin-2 n=1 Tax=Dipodomys ordii TaxID=10020 RepID=A0A1S3FQ37_DIPOR|nr:PREDICTED: paralemmin-2 [Dipodomys ordii]